MTGMSKERWEKLSLAEQLGHIGSEVGRAMELFDLTQMDKRWSSRRSELDRAREVFADAVLGGKEYQSLLPDIERYFMQFALVAHSRLT